LQYIIMGANRACMYTSAQWFGARGSGIEDVGQMRSCLIQLLVEIALLFALLWFGLPFGASFLATGALNASGFAGTHTSVEVSANPPPSLLTGKADAIRIRSDSVYIGDLRASSIDVTLHDVELLSRKIGSVDGTLDGVRVAVPSGNPVTVDQVTIHGAADAADATLTVSAQAMADLAVTMLAASSIKATVSLQAPNAVTIVASGTRQSGTLAVSNGTLLMVPTGKSLPPIALIVPGTGNPFKLTSVAVTGQQVTLGGTIDVQSLLS
jgi:LmeA-like phospholipid-binding